MSLQQRPTLAVEIAGLRKTYAARGPAPAKEALRGIDLAIPTGAFFGLLGPNGAGKSTLIGILAGLVAKTAGVATVWGVDLATDPIGVRRRLMVAKAMVHDPPVLVLDEPTAGVDVELREQLRRMIRGLNARGTTIVLTTHYLEEAETLCDRIAIIGNGRLVAHDTTANLIARVDDKALTVALDRDLAAVPAALAGLDAALEPPRRLTVRYRTGETRGEAILDAIRAAGLPILDVSTRGADLNVSFLRLVREGRAADEGAPAHAARPEAA
ncbi:ABC transporter ATP-binding protein [Caldovatus sediminis]|nr:ATP-binding cassette domain-containing protein [Caldovatus sediminis]